MYDWAVYKQATPLLTLLFPDWLVIGAVKSYWWLWSGYICEGEELIRQVGVNAVYCRWEVGILEGYELEKIVNTLVNDEI